MKRWLLHIWMMGVLSMLAASCSQDTEDPTQTSEGKVQVVFTIALDNPSTGSRATTWGDNDYNTAIGDEFDNYINPNQFFVKLFLNDGTNTSEYDVLNVAYWPTEDINVYEFVGEVDVDITATTQYTNAKIMVFANMTPSGTLGSETFGTNYNIDSNGIAQNPNGVSYIPMWGVQTANISLTPGSRYELPDPIYLLRSMAKVEVVMANKNFGIEDVKINKYNTMGYCLPNDAIGNNAISNTKELHYDINTPQSFKDNATNASTSAFSFIGNETETAEGYKCYTVYIPEYDNLTDAANASNIIVTIGGKNYTIEFKKYDNGSATTEAYNIVRNHLYRYNITGVNSGADLEVIIEINPWNYRDVTYDNTTLT